MRASGSVVPITIAVILSCERFAFAAQNDIASRRGTQMLGAQEIISRLGLAPHPREGGWFVETYRSREVLSQANLPSRYAGPRSFGTAIYYLLTPETRSALHRLRSDEVFHFYLGDAVVMLNLHPNGTSAVMRLGRDIGAGEKLQHVVPRDVWQGAYLAQESRFALLGCTVAPGFDYADYEPGARTDLLRRYPDRGAMIIRLTEP